MRVMANVYRQVILKSDLEKRKIMIAGRITEDSAACFADCHLKHVHVLTACCMIAIDVAWIEFEYLM